MDHGAKVAHVDTIEQATQRVALRARRRSPDGRCALDIAALIARERSRTHRACRSSPPASASIRRSPRRAIRAGAKEYISLPPEPELIAAVLAAVCDDERPMIADDPAMKQVIALADQIAGSDASILITGESGVGKEVMARYVHKKSKRTDKPFIAVNCARDPGAICLRANCSATRKARSPARSARRIGKFEEADGGTLLLDEISEMDVRLQVEAAARAAGTRDRPRRRRKAGARRIFACWPPPTAIWRSACATTSSAKTCSIA